MTVLTELECKLIRDRLRKHLLYAKTVLSTMIGIEYETDDIQYDTIAGPMNGIEIKAAAQKEVNDTLEALSLL